MQDYEKSYFLLFSAICDCVETMEMLLNQKGLSGEQTGILMTQVEKMKFAQQQAEEILIS